MFIKIAFARFWEWESLEADTRPACLLQLWNLWGAHSHWCSTLEQCTSFQGALKSFSWRCSLWKGFSTEKSRVKYVQSPLPSQYIGMHLYAVQSTMHNCTLPVDNVSSGLHLMVVHSRPPHCTHSAQSVGPLDPAWPAVQLLAASLSWVLQPSLAVSWFLLTISSPTHTSHPSSTSSSATCPSHPSSSPPSPHTSQTSLPALHTFHPLSTSTYCILCFLLLSLGPCSWSTVG